MTETGKGERREGREREKGERENITFQIALFYLKVRRNEEVQFTLLFKSKMF